MAIDKKLQIFDDEGNPVDYDILASDVKFNDGKDLPTKLAEMEEEIGEGGYTPPAGGIPKTDLAPSVQQTLDDVAKKVNKETGKGLSTNDYTDAEKSKLGNLPTADQLTQQMNTKANSNEVVKSISVNGTSQTKDTNGNVNIEVQAGDQVSVIQPANPDGTFIIRVGSTDYTINLNHTHENMAKIVKCTEATLPQTLENDTIYVQVDNATTPTDIECLYLFGLEFTGGGGSADDGLPKMATPKDESTIDLGSIEEGETATKDITVRAKNLNYGGSTTGLTVEAVGTGLSLTYGQTTDASVTIPQTDAMIGASLRITYSGSSSLNGELRFKQGSSVLASVVVVVVVVVDYYSGIEYNKKAEIDGTAGNISESISTDSTKCITPIYDLDGGGHVIKIRFGYTGQLIGLNGYDSSDNFIEQWVANAKERTVTLYNNVTKVKATLQQSDLDNCYIYDVTAAKWLFKGNNVTQIPT